MTWKCIGRGKNGWHADGIERGNRVSSSGGKLQDYLNESEDGTLVYDAEEADYAAYAKFVVTGPMADDSLNPGEVCRFGDKVALAHMLPGLGGDFKTIGMMALCEGDKKLGSLDYVARDLHMELMKKQVPGVKVGKVVNHKIEWDA